MESDVYVWIGLDKAGKVVHVKQGARTIEMKNAPRSSRPPGGHDSEDDDTELVSTHHVLRHKKKPGNTRGTGGVTDPCCYRDGAGNVYCWC